LRRTKNPTCDIREFETAELLRKELADHAYDLLVVSAHGHFDEATGRTMFFCGNKAIEEEELGWVPPVVFLSACQVSPRGNGSVNIGDLFLRRGALTVIGPTIPVDVAHNAGLMASFFIEMSETMHGRTGMRTLEDVWYHTTSTNAVNDILSATAWLRDWAASKDNKSGRAVMEEFTLVRSLGRLRGSTYADAEAVLDEMAQENGVHDKFRSSVRAQGYLPQSAFYVVMGWPDLIVLHDSDFDSMDMET
jgi:hypothetical protein